MLPAKKTPSNNLLPYIKRWQSNNSPNDLGIARFIFDIVLLNRKMGLIPVLKDFRPEYGVAPWAKHALAEYFVYEKGMKKEDRCFTIATFREGSKTFWFSFVLPVYEVLMGEYGIYYNRNLFFDVDYQVFRAKNKDEAKKRLMNISSFLNNKIIHLMFGNLKPSFKAVQMKDAKDTAGLLILSNRYILEASGIDQPSRGLNIFQIRPKKFTFDDPQNRENTKTPDRRQQCDNEVMEESFGAVADVGSLIYIGNKVHQDDTLGKLHDKDNHIWKKQFYTLTVKIIDGVIYPGTGDLKNEVPAWPRRDTIKDIQKKKEWFESQPRLGGLRGFLKEYYNIIKSDANYQIKYHNAEYLRAFGHNWLIFDRNGEKEYINVDIVIANDPAISEKKNTSDAVICVLAFAPDHKRYVLEYSSGKFDINDRYLDVDYVPSNGIVAITLKEIMNIRRRGSVGELIRMLLKYNARGIVVETAGQQGTFFNELCDKLEKLKLYPIKMPYSGGHEKKTEKNKECPLAYFEAGLYFIRENMDKLKADIESFPFTKQDHIDALRIAEQLASFPEKLTYNPLGIKPKDIPDLRKEPAEQYHKAGNYTNNYEPWIIY